MKNKKWLIIGAIVVIGGYMWYKNKSKKTTSTGTSTGSGTGTGTTSTTPADSTASTESPTM